MQYRIKMTPLKRDDHIKAVGILMIGDIKIRNIVIMENAKGELFTVMPNRKTKALDEEGHNIYEDIAHPITKELRDAINEAAIDSLKKGTPITLYENKDGSMVISAEAFDRPFYNKVGKASLTVNDNFVIKDVFINQKKDGSLYVTYPNYKTNQKDKEGRPVYSEIVVMTGSFRKEVSETVLSEYKADLIKKSQNRISIKNRLNEAKEKAESNAPLKDKEMTPKQMEVS